MREVLAALVPGVAILCPAQAQPAAPDLDRRIAEIAALLNGGGSYDASFTPAFRQQVSKAQFDAIAAQLRGTIGAASAPERIERANRLQATVRIRHARGVSTLRVSLDPAAPHAIAGLQVTGTAPLDDSLARIAADLATLPGEAALGVYALGDSGPRAIGETRGDAAGPIGSAFKLWVLAELAAQVTAGERRWDEAVPLARPSLPSGVTQNWPSAAPATLHSLATLMISMSDNTATDTLIRELGGARVDARAKALGADPRGLPVLTTREAFYLKSPAGEALAAGWATLSPEARRQRLEANRTAIEAATLDPTIFTGVPLRPDIEWFASPRALAATLDQLRREGGAPALAILATGAPAATRFAYMGYKGGSEPGVIAMAYLVRTRAGLWFAVAGGWNDTAKVVDEIRFAALMARALELVPQD